MTNDFKDWEQAGINTLKEDRDYVGEIKRAIKIGETQGAIKELERLLKEYKKPSDFKTDNQKLSAIRLMFVV
jgi:hypothetical protein